MMQWIKKVCNDYPLLFETVKTTFIVVYAFCILGALWALTS